MDHNGVIRATACWLRDVVVELTLCPFAVTPFLQGRIRYQVCDATRAEDIYRQLLTEMEWLIGVSAAEIETTLLIVPQGLAGFDDYLELFYAVETVIPEAGLEGVLQLASFHPDYLFAGAAPEDPANYTNRSPYPMFHLIREASLEQALTDYPKPEQIPHRNIAKLRELGLGEVHRRLLACRKI